MTSPGSLGAVPVDTARPHLELELNDLLSPSTHDVDHRRQQLIMHLLQKVCGFLDPTPRLFLQNFRRMYDCGILTDLSLLSEITLDPSLGKSLAKLSNVQRIQNMQRQVGFEPKAIGGPSRASPKTILAAVRVEPLRARSPPALIRELDVSRSRTDFGDFVKVGKGGFGKVYKAQHNMDGVVYAIKKIEFWHSGNATLLERKVLREVKCLAKLDSPYVCRYYGAWFETVWNQNSEELERSSSDSTQTQGGHDAFSSTDGGDLLNDSLASVDSVLKLEHSYSESSSSSEEDEDASVVGSRAISIPKPKARQSNIMDGLMFGDEDCFQDFSPRSSPKKSNQQGRTCKVCAGRCTCKARKNSRQSVEFFEDRRSQTNQKHSKAEKENFPMVVSESDRDESLSPASKAILDDEPPLFRENKPRSRAASIASQASRSRLVDLPKPTLDDWAQISERMRYKICLYIQSQFCEGETLRHWMAARRQVNPAQCMRLFFQMVSGLHHVHCAGVIHRDLKPSNVFMTTREGEAYIKIGDFGLAREELAQSPSPAKPRRPLGTLTYAAPEQIEGRLYCDKADVYSLGIVLFELYNVFETGMERAKQLSLVRKGCIPRAFEQAYPAETYLIRWMTAVDPAERPSAGTLLQDPRVAVFGSPPMPLRSASVPCPTIPRKSLLTAAGSPAVRSDPLSVLQMLQKSTSSPNLLPQPLSPVPLRRSQSHERIDRRSIPPALKSAPLDYHRMSRKELIASLQSLTQTVEEQQGRIGLLCSYIAELQKLGNLIKSNSNDTATLVVHLPADSPSPQPSQDPPQDTKSP